MLKRVGQKSSSIHLLSIVAGGLIASCTVVEEKPVPVTTGRNPVELSRPANFPNPVLMESNPLTEEGIRLGRTLFYDPSISASGKVSCASCHEQQLAFSDGVDLGQHGVSGRLLERHSPTLVNMAWMTNGFFWDGGSKNLESQAFGPLTHADEMGMTLGGLESRLLGDPAYIVLFTRAFDDGVTAQNVAKALAQFQRTLISAGSRYDRYVRQEAGTLNAVELKGMALVKKHCASCHMGELFTDNSFHNNGLDDDFSDPGHELIHLGRFRVTFRPEDTGAFKTPTLRNAMVSAPYMHDGRLGTMEDVLRHYTEEVKDAPTTSSLLYQKNGKPGIPLTEEDKDAVIAFLHALTDSVFLTDPALSALR